MGLKLTRTLSESGRSLVLRIPVDIERQMGLKAGQQVELWIDDNKIIVQPQKKNISPFLGDHPL